MFILYICEDACLYIYIYMRMRVYTIYIYMRMRVYTIMYSV